MPVTSGKRTREKKRTGRKTKAKRTVKRRSAAAKALADPRYRKNVVRSGKTYSRKGKTKAQEEEDEEV